MVRRLMFGAVLWFAFVLTTPLSTPAAGQGQAPSRDAARFDDLVRADFFAGVAGDTAALDRAMRLIEDALAAKPDRAEVLVWHGSGLLVRAGQAYTSGDAATSEALWQRGLKEMDDAVAKAPDDVAVLIPRGATLLEVSRPLADAAKAKALLATGVADYEKVLALQAPYFGYLSEHARGELLFGLAEGLHRLGQHERARAHFQRIVAEIPSSRYGSMAAAWLNDPTSKSARRSGCVGCHSTK